VTKGERLIPMLAQRAFVATISGPGIVAAVAIMFFLSGVVELRAAPLTAEAVNRARFETGKVRRGVDPATLKAEVVLDRLHFSVGAIDGMAGQNFRKALAAFQQHNELPPTGKLDGATWNKLTQADDQPAIIDYEIAADDVEGRFADKLPTRMEQMAELPGLPYAGPREKIAEKFHMNEKLLRALNPRSSFTQSGARILVASVAPMPQGDATRTAGKGKPAEGQAKVAAIDVDKTQQSVRAFDKDGKLLAFYPASIGSAEKPAPSGSFKVTGVAPNPTYHYDPKFAFKEVKVQQKFTIKPGPNNPVGIVWIDLSAPSYGIHGTPTPETVGKAESHGCVRLTNWDALALAAMVGKGTVVRFNN